MSTPKAPVVEKRDQGPKPYNPNPTRGHGENTAASRTRHRADFRTGLPRVQRAKAGWKPPVYLNPVD